MSLSGGINNPHAVLYNRVRDSHLAIRIFVCGHLIKTKSHTRQSFCVLPVSIDVMSRATTTSPSGGHACMHIFRQLANFPTICVAVRCSFPHQVCVIGPILMSYPCFDSSQRPSHFRKRMSNDLGHRNNEGSSKPLSRANRSKLTCASQTMLCGRQTHAQHLCVRFVLHFECAYNCKYKHTNRFAFVIPFGCAELFFFSHCVGRRVCLRRAAIKRYRGRNANTHTMSTHAC